MNVQRDKGVAIDWAKLTPSASPLAHGIHVADPFMAFCVAWKYDHEPENGLGLDEDFPKLLQAMCVGRTSSQKVVLSGDPGIAFPIFLTTISHLLRTWREEPASSGLPGSAAAHWCDQHPEILERIQDALASRSRFFRPEMADWTLGELRPGGLAHVTEHRKLKLSTTDRFVGQRSWGQAAQTAAYALFGDFLAGEPRELGFCQRCEQPFLRGKKTIFCSERCGHADSSTISRDRRNALKRRRGLRNASKSLGEWLQKSHRTNSDWRLSTERAYGIRTKDGRHSRLMGEYIRASQTSPGSPEREKLLRSLLSSSTQTPHQRENVQLQLDGFLQDVAEAHSRAKASNVK